MTRPHHLPTQHNHQVTPPPHIGQSILVNMRFGIYLAAMALVLGACAQSVAIDDKTPKSAQPAAADTSAESSTEEDLASSTQTALPETTTTTERPPVSYQTAEVAGSGEIFALVANKADTTIEVAVANGAVVIDERRFVVDNGSSVGVIITSDVAEELHVHGYDIRATLIPDETIEFTFIADEPGVYEVELHHAPGFLFEVQVNR